MPIDFSKLNLEIIDTAVNASPDIYINANNITFTKKVVDELNYPAYIQYSTDVEQKVFALHVARSDGIKAAPFSKPRGEQKQTLSTGNKNVVEPVRKMMENIWKPNMRYKVTGYLLDDKKTMVFVLPEAVEYPSRPSENIDTAE